MILLRHRLEGSCEIAVRMPTSVRYVCLIEPSFGGKVEMLL